MADQNFKNHIRVEPKYLSLLALALICFIASIAHLVQEHSRANILLVPVTFALLFAVTLIRSYSLQVQNRVIRLEESLRMKSLGVSPEGLTLKQVIALRFASDAELPALAARAKAEAMEPKAIKAAVQNWRADFERV